jgi:hypothetical protein
VTGGLWQEEKTRIFPAAIELTPELTFNVRKTPFPRCFPLWVGRRLEIIDGYSPRKPEAAAGRIKRSDAFER